VEQAVVVSHWMPMCFLFDPAIDESKAEQNIRDMVSAYRSCGIQLRPFAFTLKPNYPQDVATLKEAAVRACPLSTHFRVRGAVQVMTASAQTPKEMCQDSSAKGCSTLCSPVSFSVLSPDAGPATALHESLHSNCCGPVCVDEGQGTGITVGTGIELALLSKASHYAGSPDTLTAITSEGCAALRAGASRNDIQNWQSREGERFYHRQTDVSAQVDILGDRNVFNGVIPVVQITPAVASTPVEEVVPAPAKDLLNRLKESKPSLVRMPASYGAIELPSVLPSEADAKALPKPRNDETDIPPLFPAEPPQESDTRALGAGLRGKPGDSLRRSTGSGINRIDAYGGAGEGD
jgi:hypothetical protein